VPSFAVWTRATGLQRIQSFGLELCIHGPGHLPVIRLAWAAQGQRQEREAQPTFTSRPSGEVSLPMSAAPDAQGTRSTHSSATCSPDCPAKSRPWQGHKGGNSVLDGKKPLHSSRSEIAWNLTLGTTKQRGVRSVEIASTSGHSRVPERTSSGRTVETSIGSLISANAIFGMSSTCAMAASCRARNSTASSQVENKPRNFGGNAFDVDNFARSAGSERYRDRQRLW